MDVLFATSNKHKVAEANVVVVEHDIRFSVCECPYPEVRSELVADVARDGAAFVFAEIKKPVIVEDSGLFVRAFGGFPGAYSRFVYDKIGCEGILKLMAGVEERSARFTSAVGYADKNGVEVFEGQVKGVLTEQLRGEGGFGYDPVFTPMGYTKTFAEDPKNKNKVSHRRMAFELLCEFLSSR